MLEANGPGMASMNCLVNDRPVMPPGPEACLLMTKTGCHNRAIAALAHRRLCVMFAMLHDGKPFQEVTR